MHSSIARFLRWSHSPSHVASMIRPSRMEKFASISRNPARTSERFCAEPSNTPCLWFGPPPVIDDEQNERIEDLSVAFSHETQTLGVPYIDLFSALRSDDAYRREVLQNDGAHPRSEGYSKMARIIGASPSWWFHTLGAV